ncbi:MAG: Ig-like domain-containing protein, partial [Gemmatimonadota bacterium]
CHSGPPASMAIDAGDAQTAQVNTAVSVPPSVRVSDQWDDPVSSVTVLFRASGDGGVTGSPAVTGADGIASVTSWTLGTTAATGSDTLWAVVVGVDSVMFTASATPGRTASVIVMPAGAAVSGAGATQAYGVEAVDAYGNPISSPNVTWSSLNPNVATIGASTGVAAAVASGQATVMAVVDEAVGYGVLTVSVPGAGRYNIWSAVTSGTFDALHGLWGASPTDVFAVGGNGSILHYDGTAWSADPSVTTSDVLFDVWGASSADVYAVGAAGTVLHFDGTSWSAMSSGTSESLHGVWGASGVDVYAVGAGGTILHYDGVAWGAMASGSVSGLQAVWGSSTEDIFAVGDGGTILHYDGTAWSVMSSGTAANLSGVWGAAGTNVYAVGEGNTVVQYNGSTWFPIDIGVAADFTGIHGDAANDIYVVSSTSGIVHFDGSEWTHYGTGTFGYSGIWTASNSPGIAVGSDGVMSRGVRNGILLVSPDDFTLNGLADTVQLSVEARDAGDNVISGVYWISWESLDPLVATVDADGLVAAVANGTTTIIASAPGGATGSASATVDIRPPEPGQYSGTTSEGETITFVVSPDRSSVEAGLQIVFALDCESCTGTLTSTVNISLPITDGTFSVSEGNFSLSGATESATTFKGSATDTPDDPPPACGSCSAVSVTWTATRVGPAPVSAAVAVGESSPELQPGAERVVHDTYCVNSVLERRQK